MLVVAMTAVEVAVVAVVLAKHDCPESIHAEGLRAAETVDHTSNGHSRKRGVRQFSS